MGSWAASRHRGCSKGGGSPISACRSAELHACTCCVSCTASCLKCSLSASRLCTAFQVRALSSAIAVLLPSATISIARTCVCFAEIEKVHNANPHFSAHSSQNGPCQPPLAAAAAHARGEQACDTATPDLPLRGTISISTRQPARTGPEMTVRSCRPPGGAARSSARTTCPSG